MAILNMVYGEQQKKPMTFTVTFTETSNPAQFNPVWSDDATGLTAGSTNFDEFFGYSAVRLSAGGVETAEITQAQSGGAGKLDITQLGDLTSGDNVMIKFPVRGIKMTKNGSTITLSITAGLGRESEGYQYYAFQRTGDIDANASTTVSTSPFYLGTYLSYTDGTTLKSWSSKMPQGNYTMSNAITYAGNNGSGYTIMGFYQKMYINALYMMKYGNPDSQTKIGAGYTEGNSSYVNTGGTNSQANSTYGTSSTSVQMKLFGLEDWRGNKRQRLGGAFIDSSKNLWVALHNFTGSLSTSESQYKNTLLNMSGYGEISEISGTNKGMFYPIAKVTNSSFNTYRCDYCNFSASTFVLVGGNKTFGKADGTFLFNAIQPQSSSSAEIASRLMFI